MREPSPQGCSLATIGFMLDHGDVLSEMLPLNLVVQFKGSAGVTLRGMVVTPFCPLDTG
jgi:hypothetical protein